MPFLDKTFLLLSLTLSFHFRLNRSRKGLAWLGLLFHYFCHVMVKILYTKIRNKTYINANKIIEIQKTAADRRAMIVGRAKTPQTNQEWKALPPLGPYYGKDWFIEKEGEGAFDPVINRTPAQAAGARLMPKPPNL
jgi:hypothetical protein